MTEKNTNDETSYEDYLEELTNLVDEIGRDDCPVDQLEIKVRRAADLIRNLRGRLASTETTVQEVLKELENDRKVDQG
ncbi:MAG: exodeoxyribonuclease VII small subunit [Candidatus Aegiribacteria sp.]|nr:exodeoxyribonuclease VII small subunit [Candidatus Aegiribacteria sp.]